MSYHRSAMDEHTRIVQFLAPLSAGEEGAFGLQNDAAALDVPAGKKLIITTDSVIAGIHLPADATPQQLATKLIRRNISDLAAMGGATWRYTLNLHVPENTGNDWWQALSATLANEQAHYGMVLVGGDCSSGAATPHLTATLYGLCDAPLTRSGAQQGDDVYVTGTLGDAALFLHTQNDAFSAAYYAPEPPIAFAQTLAGLASACIDISDGLVADAAHIATASGCALALQQHAIPLSKTAQPFLPEYWETIVTGGDDYQLLFTTRPAQHETLMQQAKAHGIQLTKMGNVQQGKDVQVMDENGHTLALTQTGYRHS